jgi:hypothetical protein
MNNIRKISALTLVLATLVGSTQCFAYQGTAQDQNACQGDVISLCMSAVGSFTNPNVPAITACLKANMSKLSAPCKAVMSRPAPKK